MCRSVASSRTSQGDNREGADGRDGGVGRGRATGVARGVAEGVAEGDAVGVGVGAGSKSISILSMPRVQVPKLG